MANNYKYSGKRITILNPTAAVAAGVLTRQRGIIGIPQNNRTPGQSVSFAIEGVWGMTFSAYAGIGAGPMPAAGSVLYWDTSAATLSNGAANDDFAAVKCITSPSAVDGSFDGLLLPSANGRPVGQDHA